MITRKEIDLAAPLTTPQIEMLTALAASPSTADVDCPELMAAQQNSFHRIIRKTESRFVSGDTDTSKKQRYFLRQSSGNLVINLYIVNILIKEISKYQRLQMKTRSRILLLDCYCGQRINQLCNMNVEMFLANRYIRQHKEYYVSVPGLKVYFLIAFRKMYLESTPHQGMILTMQILNMKAQVTTSRLDA